MKSCRGQSGSGENNNCILFEKDIKDILSIIETNFSKATVLMEIISPVVVKRIKEKSIDESNAKFTWGIKSGKGLEAYNSISNSFLM